MRDTISDSDRRRDDRRQAQDPRYPGPERRKRDRRAAGEMPAKPR